MAPVLWAGLGGICPSLSNLSILGPPCHILCCSRPHSSPYLVGLHYGASSTLCSRFLCIPHSGPELQPPAKGLGRTADRAKRKLAAPPTTGTLCSPPLHPSLYPGPSLRASAQLLALFAVPRRISLRFCFLPPPPLLALTHHGWGWGLGAVLAVRCSALCSSCELCEPRPAAPGPGSAPRGHVGQSASVTADRDVPAVPTSARAPPFSSTL